MYASITLKNAREPPPMKILFMLYWFLQTPSFPAYVVLWKEPTDLNEEGVQLLHKVEIDYENHEKFF
jgi:hypothetical protein